MADIEQVSLNQSADPVAARARPGLFAVTRTGMLLILIGHLLACAAVVWLMPGGFAWLSREIFTYRLLPAIVGVAILVSLIRPKLVAPGLVLETLKLLWLGVGTVCLASFTSSLQKLGVGAFVVAFVLVLAVRAAKFELRAGPRGILIAVALISAWLAVGVLRSPPPSTKPLNVATTQPGLLDKTRLSVPVGTAARLDPSQANVTFAIGRRFVQVEPVLTFLQRSPDQTWTVLASRDQRRPPTRTYRGLERSEQSVKAFYHDGDADRTVAGSVLNVSSPNASEIEIEAVTHLPNPIFTHLNAFTQVTIGGHRRLSIGFSPIPDARFEVTHAGYPFGEPAQFAYLDRGRVLHVVRARSGEKGPYEELGRGVVEGPITVTFYDVDERLFDLELADFTAQASTERSPAAGWGVPENAIEFGRLSEDPRSPASIFVTLAATSVGRGWSSVGHAAGTYRNRLVIRLPETRTP